MALEKIITNINKQALTSKLTLLIIGLTAGSGLLIPATYASFHPVTSDEIADGTIASVDIKNGEVKAADIGTGAVTTGKISDTNGVYSVDIGDGQVGSVDIGDGQVTSTDILDRTITWEDIAGFEALTMVSQVIGTLVTIPPGESRTTTIDCSVTQYVISGGFNAGGNVQVVISRPIDYNTWQIQGVNKGTTEQGLEPYAVCIPTALKVPS